jgi:uncharacterized membrane protein YdjX (TVP38/TMEM64 family)
MAPRAPRLRVLALLALLLVAVLALAHGYVGPVTLDSLRAQRDQLLAARDRYPLAFALAYVAVHVTASAVSPAGPLVITVAGGAIFGVALGLALASFGCAVGATLTFLAARHVFRDAFRARYGDRFAAVEQRLSRDGVAFLLSLRVFPVIPFMALNSLMALTPMSAWTFYWVSQLGLIPVTLALVAAGAELATLGSLTELLRPRLLALLLALAAAPWVIRRIRAARPGQATGDPLP